MNAARLKLHVEGSNTQELQWQRITIQRQDSSAEPRGEGLRAIRTLTAEPADARCPHCDSIIYSRRHKLCGICARELPPEFLFTPAESERLESILRIEQAQHREWMKRSILEAFTDR